MVKLICVSFSVLVLAVTAAAGAQSSTQAASGASPSSGLCHSECLSGHPSLTDSAPTASSASALVATQADCQPEAALPLGLSCFEKLELCGESCGNDVACNRSCVKAYHACLGH